MPARASKETVMHPDADTLARLTRAIARREAVLARVRAMLIERLHLRLEPDDIEPDVSLFGTGLALDSLDAVEIIVSLESDFGVSLPADADRRVALRTPGSLVDLVLRSEDVRARAEVGHV